ncbi:DUF418 domain-containing protein [Guptibacillus algicola]|uniref:DUF418 domain-containing protein n=1 Tax=Guptibacillus algicola TaxID=225844 RepID=UPI001CD59CB0|nr:DUF418 domain-containing protein [Alkalihalobacillus algicola]MCA0986487.1 DUF418 domain-containing protein [Alkalihalobacillus algicola]
MGGNLTPVSGNERIHSIDAMRGFALLGIFLVNMIDFHSPFIYVDQIEYWGNQVNQWSMHVIDFFAQASFYPLFSFLFGYGFIIFRNRVLERGGPFYPLMIRRLLFLMFLGVLHFTLIWHGDILFTYSLCGLVLLLFIKLKGTRLLQIGMILWLIYAIFLFILMLPLNAMDFTSHQPNAIQQSIEVYSSGSFQEITEQRVSDWAYVNGGWNGFFLLFVILPFFLFGSGFAKKGWLNGDAANLPIIRRLLFIGFVGFVIKFLPYILDSYAYLHLQDSFGGPLVSLFYIASFVLLYQSGKRIKVFEWVGKLALSNYLFQSLVSTLIFYNYGLGFYGEVGVSTGILLLLIIFFIQIVLSKVWLKSFAYGPLEWVWRLVTYQRRFAIKRKEETSFDEGH